jgi:hypothetical protein
MYLQEIGWEVLGLNVAGSGYGPLAGCCECGSEPPGSIKYGEYLAALKNF